MNLPLGYRYAALHAGIRKGAKDDLALIVSDTPAAAAAVFTRNRVQAAPVRLGRAHLAQTGGRARAILANAGNANCATRTGDQVAAESCEALARELGCPAEEVLPASTGVIGVELDGGLINRAIPQLVGSLSSSRFEDCADAILTTDTRRKVACQDVRLAHGSVSVAGMTKGAGMIQPNMATTLGFVMTDAALTSDDLRPMLKSACDKSYHRLSVDGDTSTNDTVVLLANGASGVTPDANERKVVAELLCWVLEDLAEQIAHDGEGARKLLTIRVLGADNTEAAERIARSIANSPLVKTAVAGSDPNWGRILSAAGNAGVDFMPENVDIFLQGVPVCEGGLAADFDERDLKTKLNDPECRVRFVLRGGGPGQSRFWSCDFTEDYIRINASYRT